MSHIITSGSMGVKPRLALLVFVAIFLLALVGLGGWFGISRMSETLAVVEGERLPVATLLGEIRSQTATLLQFSFEILSRERQASAQEQFKKVNKRKLLISTALEKAMADFEKLPLSAEEVQTWQKFKVSMAPWRARNDEVSQIITALGNNDDPEVQKQLFAQYKLPLASWGHVQAAVDINLSKLLTLNQAEVTLVRERGIQARRVAMQFIFITLGVAVLLLSILGLLIVRSITMPLGLLQHTIIAIAESKDFTGRVKIKTRDEIGQTAVAFNRLLEQVQDSLQVVLSGAEHISGAARQASTAASRVAASSGQQSEAASTMAAAIEEMTVGINHINHSMGEVHHNSQEASGAADAGAQIVARSSAGMDQIAASVANADVAIRELSTQSSKISQILQVIKEVADQTNLLALNAAIEAARAGEQGRGFAVVADEVRKLAERTTRSTGDIAALVSSMHASGGNAISAMQSVNERVANGKQLSLATAEQMRGIHQCALLVRTSVNDIAAALNEQSSTALSIAQQVEGVARMSENNDMAANETAKVAGDLNSLAGDLRGAVRQFTV